ncbi:MAG: hypothetical protein WBV39_06910 [Rudaea sp.]
MHSLRNEHAGHRRDASATRPDSSATRDADQAAPIDEAAPSARHLESELSALRSAALDLDDLREDNARLRAAAAQMQREILILNRALDGEVLPSTAFNPDVSGTWPLDVNDAGLDMPSMTQMPEDVFLLRAHVENLTGQLQAMRKSLSWRITRPLRALGRWLKR